MTTRTVLDLQADKQRMRTPKEKSDNSLRVVSREIMCFKIIKLIFNKTIYTIIFLILK